MPPPGIIAGEIDVLAERRCDMRQQFVRDTMPLLSERVHGVFDIDGIP
jgi:hypothetical protein